MEENRSCENCRHFIKHYTLSKKRIMPVDCGHCICSKMRGISMKKRNMDGCRYWEQNEISRVSKESIENIALYGKKNRRNDFDYRAL